MTGAASDREADPKRSAPASGQKVIWEIKAPGANGAAIGTKAFRGTRASANTSGSDFTWALGPVKLRGKGTRTERRKLVLLPDRFLKERTLLLKEPTLPKYDPAV